MLANVGGKGKGREEGERKRTGGPPPLANSWGAAPAIVEYSNFVVFVASVPCKWFASRI